MTEELWKNSAIIAKRNVDSNQTPISVNLTELKQIIDVHSCLVLNQLPDEHYGIDIDGFTEVYDIEDVTTRSYKVDYANGVLYFHPNNIGKMLQVNYYGVGCTLLSASRIYTKYDKYGNVLETLEELLDKGKLYIQAIDALGGAVEVINRVENANATGTVLHENLLEDIEIGSKLNKDLIDNNHMAENTITTLIQKTETGNQTINNLTDKTNLANQKKQELEVTTSNANNKNTELNNTISTANNTDTKLKDTILSGQDSINKINATGNKSLIIGASQFVNNQYTWTHNMNSEDLHVTFFDSVSKEPLMPDYKIIDKNNILIKNSVEHPNIKVVLSSSFYQGNSLLGTNAEEFAGDSIGTGGGYTRLKDNVGYKYPVTKSDAVYMTDGTTKLTKHLGSMTIDGGEPSQLIANKIQIKRGLKASLPTLSAGEPVLCTDTEEFYVGKGTKNIKLINENDYQEIINKMDQQAVIVTTKSELASAITSGKNIFIPKGVSISTDTEFTITTDSIKITGQGTITQTSNYKSIFLVRANNVLIDGITFYGTQANTTNLPNSYASAVIIDSKKNCTIRNCFIYGCSKSNGTDSGSGIYLTGAENCLVENNYIEGCFHGINTDAVFNGSVSKRNIIIKNTIKSCKFGYVLDLQGSDYASHIGDVFESNQVIGSLKNGVQIDDVSSGFIVKNNIVELSLENGIAVMHRSGNGVIDGNITRNNNMCGMVFNHITLGHIVSNLIVKNNIIKANKTDGIQIYNVLGLNIENNVIFDNLGNGITSIVGSYAQKIKCISNEIAYNHGNGVSLVDCRGVVINNNSIYYNSNGNEGVCSGVLIDRANIITSNIFIENNIFWGEGNQTHKYSVEVKATSYDFILVMGNQLQGAKTGAIFHNGSVKVKFNNGAEDAN